MHAGEIAAWLALFERYYLFSIFMLLNSRVKKMIPMPKHQCCKKGQPFKNKSKVKSCEIKGGGQEMAVMIG